MKDGFIRVAAATPKIKVADCVHNMQEILGIIKSAPEDTSLLVSPNSVSLDIPAVICSFSLRCFAQRRCGCRHIGTDHRYRYCSFSRVTCCCAFFYL